jgi:hypothetical protein
MHTYLVRFWVSGIGMLEESIRAYTPLDAQKAVQGRYRGSQVIVHDCR